MSDETNTNHVNWSNELGSVKDRQAFASSTTESLVMLGMLQMSAEIIMNFVLTFCLDIN